MGPKLYYRITMFFGPHVASFLDAPSALVLLFSDLQRPPTCCSHAHDASPELRLHNVLSTSGQHCLDLSPMENYNFRWGPNFIESPSCLVLMFSDLQQPPTCCSHAPDASPEFKLRSVLSTSNQHCIVLSPMDHGKL